MFETMRSPGSYIIPPWIVGGRQYFYLYYISP